jgi:hypothetical protein
MNEYDIKRFGLILSIQAGIEGMKAENLLLTSNNLSATFTAKDFFIKAEEIREIVNKHNYSL